jgi:NAD(P)-dependent dehydrogenase (short-subunit alcohol dehydrogenase family)
MNEQVVLITGTSSGFGLLMAASLCKQHKVYATMRDVRKAQALKDAAGVHAGRLQVLPLDVTDSKSIIDVIDMIREKEGQLHCVINNAGYGIGGFFEDLTEKEIRDQFETNFFGLQKVTREALPLMRTSRGPRKVINISSIAGHTGTPCLSAYNASKWAVEGFSEALFFELKPFDIDVVLVEPGAFKTKIFTDNVRLAQFMKHKQSPYYEYSQKLLGYLEKMQGSLKADPKVVSKLVEKIVNHPTPKFRYLVGVDAKIRLFLKRLLPFSWYSGIILKKFYKSS